MDTKDLVALVEAGAPALATLAASKPALKLLEMLESCLGAMGKPFLAVYLAEQEGRAKLVREAYEHQLKMMRARNRQDLADLKLALAAPKSSEPNQLPAVGFDANSKAEKEAADTMVSYQQAKRRANALTIAAEAVDQLPPDAETSEEPVDDDWTARFFSYAQDVSSEQLQKLWGRILATEVTRPGAVPPRSLDLLRNLSRDEANLFERCVARMTDKWLHVPTRSNGLTAWEIRLLRDAGVFDSTDRTLAWTPTSPEAGALRNPFGPGRATLDFLGPCRVELTVKSMPLLHVETLSISARPLANALIRLRNGIVADEAYLKSLCKEMGQDGNKAVIIRRDQAPSQPPPAAPPPEAPAPPPVEPEPGDP